MWLLGLQHTAACHVTQASDETDTQSTFIPAFLEPHTYQLQQMKKVPIQTEFTENILQMYLVPLIATD
jgi:hypothetical protein